MNIEAIQELANRLINYEKETEQAKEDLLDAEAEVKRLQDRIELGVRSSEQVRQAIKDEANS